MLNYSQPLEKLSPPSVNLQDLSRWLKALSEPKRLLLLDLIIQGVQCNCELGDELGIAPNLISHHLSVLREVGLVNAERDPLDSRWIYYSVNCGALEQLNTAFGSFFDPKRVQPRRLSCGPRTLVSTPSLSVHKNE